MKKERLVLFTRYPEPGVTKTRLIPALGAVGAARVQEGMTGHAVWQARVWAARSGGQVAVRYAGGSRALLRRWLGPELLFEPQGKGDLGARMRRAVQASLQAGVSKVVLLGCDAPEITPDLLLDAFAALDQHDVVLGPAHDGGYYLIGMKAVHDCLFEDVLWGGDTVLSTTWGRLAQAGLHGHELPTLTDVDEEVRLPVWSRIYSSGAPTQISVIIPALNESAHIVDAIVSAQPGALEVLVSDGGSTDETVRLAAEAGARVISSPRGRAAQMNAAAREARGGSLVFLHADSTLPEGYAEKVSKILEQEQTGAGAFQLALDAPGFRYRVVEWGVRQRCRWFALPYGDQALFMRRAFFATLGGYAQLPLMEDYDWVKRAGRRTSLCVAPLAVQAAARRWSRMGVVRTTLTNQIVLCAVACGVPHARLATWYR